MTWVGPAPKWGKVALTDGGLFDAIETQAGSEVPEDFPDKYAEGLSRSDVFNSGLLWDIDEVVRWQRRYGIELEREPMTIFEYYLKTGYAIFGTLVTHPDVVEPERFRNCSVVLQRAAAILDDDREELHLRSYFHSATDDGEFVNFVPSGGVSFAFPTKQLWYPLELSGVITEPASWLVLDVLTPEGRGPKVPSQFRAERIGATEFRDRKYQTTRVTARLDVERRAPKFADLQLPLEAAS